MPRQAYRRLGLYYLILRRSTGRIFTEHKDYSAFMEVLETVLNRTGYQLHAFCFLPTQVHLALEMSNVSMPDFCHRMVSKYNRLVTRESSSGGGSLELSYEPALIDVDEKCREVIRFIHLLPLKAGQDPGEYVWSGHRTYLGKAKIPCLEVGAGLRLFSDTRREARQRYEQYALSGLKAAESLRFTRSLAHDLQSLSEEAPSSMGASADQLLATLAKLGKQSISVLRSTAKDQWSTLLRAMAAWHCARLELSTVEEMAAYFHRDPSALYLAIKRYSQLYRDLFSEPGELDGLERLCSEVVNKRPRSRNLNIVPHSLEITRERISNP